MKKFVLALCALLFLLPATVFASLPDVPVGYAVLDQAGVLSPETRAHLVERNQLLFELTGGEVRFLVVDYLPRGFADLEAYAVAVFEHWGIGDRNRENGVLVVLGVREEPRRFWITTGTGLHAGLPRSALNELTESYFLSAYDAGAYDQAVQGLFAALAERIYELFPPVQAAAPVAHVPQQGGTPASPPNGGGANFISLLVTIGLLVLLFLLLSGGRRRRFGGGMMMGGPFMRRRRFGGWGMGGGGFLGGYLLGRARHGQPRAPRTPAPKPGGGFNRGGGTSGGGGGGYSKPGGGYTRPPGGGLGGGGFGGRSGGYGGGGFTRGGGTRGGGFGRR